MPDGEGIRTMTTVKETDKMLGSAIASLDDVKGDGSGCPSAQRIWESASGRLSSTGDQAVVSHLGECGSCSAAWRIAHELARDASPADVSTRTAWQRWAPMLVAASIVFAVAGFSLFRYLKPDTEGPVYRQQQEEWLEAETATLPRESCILRWSAGPEGTTYDLLIMDEDLQPLDRARSLDRPEFNLEAADLETVAAGGNILWRVTAHLPDGRRVVSRTFTTQLE